MAKSEQGASVALALTVPSETIFKAIINQVRKELELEDASVEVVRITRKKGGGVEADVLIRRTTAS